MTVFSCFLLACRTGEGTNYKTWETYRGDEGSNAYSQLSQINTGNVKQLKIAWTHSTGDKSDYFSLESSPIIVNDILYGISPRLNTIAFLFGMKDNRVYQVSDQENKSVTINKKDTGKRYSLKALLQLKDQNGYPGVKPPWGTLNAVDLNSGELAWKIPLGQFPELAAKGHFNTGTQLFGGGIVTAGGLVFIGASQDEKFRAIDKNTGQILWEYQLPCGGYATPATYEADGKQYVVIAAGGGGRQRTKAGDYYIAFALP